MKAMRGVMGAFLAVAGIATTMTMGGGDAAANAGNPRLVAHDSTGRPEATLPEGFVRTTVDGKDAIGIWQNGVLVAAYAP
jgi:hypothetical protein